MSPKKDKSSAKEVPGIFSDIKIDVNALDGHYNKGNTISSDTYKPYTIFGELDQESPTGDDNSLVLSNRSIRFLKRTTRIGIQIDTVTKFSRLIFRIKMKCSTHRYLLVVRFMNTWVILKISVVAFNYHNPYNQDHLSVR